jgi:hypothetical protein
VEYLEDNIKFRHGGYKDSQKDWQPVFGNLCVLNLKLMDINGNTIIQNLLHDS